MGGDYRGFRRNISMSHRSETKIVGEPFCVSESCLDMAKNSRVGGAMRGGQIITISVEKIFNVSHCRRNIVKETHSVFQTNLLVSKNCTQRRVGFRVRIRGWASRFCLKFFCLTVAKNFVWKISGMEKMFMDKKEWGGGGNAFVEKFVSQDRTE